MTVTIIGTGNVAQALGHLLYQQGHTIVQVYGRRPEAADALASQWQAEPVSEWAEVGKPPALLYLVALSDSALPQLAQWWQPRQGLVVHTAGSVPMQVLEGVSRNHGVLYPLQSLRQGRLPQAPFPLLVEANTPDDTALLHDLALQLTGMATSCTSPQRLQYHLAAVVANNFTNHLYTLAMDYCKQYHLDDQLLVPMIQETAARLSHHQPADMQTGPARRHDESTLLQHQQLLQQHPQLLEVYLLFSRLIGQYFGPPGG